MLTLNKLWLSTYVLSFINKLWLWLLPVLGFICAIIFSFKWCCSDKYVKITPSAWDITNETCDHVIITKIFYLVWTLLFMGGTVVHYAVFTRSFRSADNATSIVRLRISEKYSKNVLMPIVRIDTCTHSLKNCYSRVLICFLSIKQYIFHRCVSTAS